MSGLTNEDRAALVMSFGQGLPSEVLEPHIKVVERIVELRCAEALREAARFFEYEMSKVWGGRTTWLSTGDHVADVVASVLRERAEPES